MTSKSSVHLFVISGASGTGKTTLCRYLEKEVNLFFSVSATTRPPRPGEVEGRDYFFLSGEAFQKQIFHQGFLEWAEVHGYFYGTPLEPIERALSRGQNVLLDLDTQGALKLKEMRDDVVLIFLQPPSVQALRERLTDRGTDAPEVIERRVEKAESEIAKSHCYDYTVVNQNLETAKRELKAIFLSFS